VGDGLVEQGERIAQAALGRPRDQRQHRGLEMHALGRQYVLQARPDLLLRYQLQVELQAARQDGNRYFLRIGGGEYEFDVRGRLLQRLQHGVECIARQHVHLVDDVHLVASRGGRVQRVLQQLAHVVHLRVRSSVELDEVDEAARVDFGARRAFAAGGRGNAGFTIERLGDDARERGLANAAGTGEKVSVVQSLVRKRALERPHHVLLPYQLGKRSRAPLAGKNLSHRKTVNSER